MAKKNKDTEENVQTVKAGYAPWAIINKDTDEVLGVFNPQGKPTALRRVAIGAATKASLSFTRIKLIPVGLMSPEYREKTRVLEAPILEDDRAKK
jgi:hypothetical protein